jgi:hypothetical protein
MAIWVLKEGRREGPYTDQDVRELVYEGTYTERDSAIRDGQLDWSTVAQILAAPEAAPAESAQSQPPALPSPLPAAPGGEDAAAPLGIPAQVSLIQDDTRPARVEIVDINVPFGSLVMLMIKLMLAAIPALLILGIIMAAAWAFLLGIIALLLRH